MTTSLPTGPELLIVSPCNLSWEHASTLSPTLLIGPCFWLLLQIAFAWAACRCWFVPRFLLPPLPSSGPPSELQRLER